VSIVVRSAAFIALCAGTCASAAPLPQRPVEHGATSLHALARTLDIQLAARLVSRLGTVSSMFRSREHNRAVGGAPNSYHLIGRAIDVARRAHVKHADLHATLAAAGFNIIESLDEGDHSHFAFGPRNSARPNLAVALVRPATRPATRDDTYEGTLLADRMAGKLATPVGSLDSALTAAAVP
jgi:hypothetical protein